ncbi:MAG: cytochrome-c peroxidase [Planctomycetaceae bacterium TMED240]|nr:cytochrome-c peroxidase [Rhodopirellula sp.]OUX08696.1 MAG: cytochrome-c peroxidase [Planctomycetaceae bacterium TMED240]
MQIPATTIVLCLFVTSAFGQISELPSVAGGSKRQLTLPVTPYRYADQLLPRHVKKVAELFDNTPESNPITDEGATLGRVLFYDPNLSANGSTSCSSCHSQKTAFTDARRFSKGFEGKFVDRNSMSLVNLRYYRPGKFFWDERAESLEDQVLMPIENPIEMGHELTALVSQLQNDPIYPPLFHDAFGTSEVTKERLSLALAQFLRSMISVNSRFDQGRIEVASVLDPFPNFSEQENYGKQQFFGRAKCSECHLPETEGKSVAARQSAFFQLEGPLVNGIDSDSDQVDGGVGAYTSKEDEWGRFKSTSLRNVALTAPYMHDGRFRTLDQVIEHYNWSVKPHRNLDQRLEDFAANGLALPEVEKVALAAFLGTLTDQTFITDPKFSDPFTQAD